MATKILTDADIEKLDSAPVLTDDDVSAFENKTEKSGRVSKFNPLGLDPVSGVVGADPMDILKGANRMAYGAVEGASGGLLKASDPETGENLAGDDIAGRMAGFIAGPGKIARSVTAPLQGVKYAGPVLRGITEGALGGAAFPADDLESRITNAKFGAIIGGVAEPVVSGISKAWQGFQKFRQAKQALKDLDKAKFDFKITPEAQAPGKIQLRQQRLAKAEKEIIQTQKSSIESQMKGLSDQLNVETQSKAQAIKRPTLDYMRAFKDEWGKHFDELLESAPEQGIKISELRKIHEETIEELTELGIDPKGPVVSTINKSVNSFKPSQIMKEVEEVNSLGVKVKTKALGEADDFINNRDLVNVRRNVRGSLSAQAKGGQYTEEDIAQAIFDRKLGEKLGTTLGEGFEQLNKSYKKFSDLSRFAYKNLRPKASEFDIIPGTRIIKKVASGKANEGELKAISQLEEVTGIKFTEKASHIGSKIEELKNFKQSKIQEIKTKFSKRQAELSRLKRQAGAGNKDKIRKIDEEIRANREIVESLGLAKRIGGAIAFQTGSSILSYFLLNKLLRRD